MSATILRHAEFICNHYAKRDFMTKLALFTDKNCQNATKFRTFAKNNKPPEGCFRLCRQIIDRIIILNAMYKHLFFDLDRTFWDVDQNQHDAMVEIFNTFDMGSHYPDFESYYQTFRDINEHLWIQYRDGIIQREYLRNHRFVEVLSKVGITNSQLAMDMSDEYLRVAPTYNALLPNSVEVLEYLHEKSYPMSLITNGFNEVQFHKVEYSGLSKFFQRITTSEFAGVSKPRAGIFEYAMRKAAVKASECVMIGDDVYSDIFGGSSVGMDTIYLNTHGTEHNQEPTHEIRTLLELKNIL